MIPRLQVQWSWIRTSQEQWLCPGLPLQMRRGMTDYTTWCPSGTPSNALGGQWQTTSSTINSQLPTFCLDGSITSGYLLKMTWVFHHLPNPLCLKSKRKKVCASSSITKTSESILTFLCTMLNCSCASINDLSGVQISFPAIAAGNITLKFKTTAHQTRSQGC